VPAAAKAALSTPYKCASHPTLSPLAPCGRGVGVRGSARPLIGTAQAPALGPGTQRTPSREKKSLSPFSHKNEIRPRSVSRNLGLTSRVGSERAAAPESDFEPRQGASEHCPGVQPWVTRARKKSRKARPGSDRASFSRELRDSRRNSRRTRAISRGVPAGTTSIGDRWACLCAGSIEHPLAASQPGQRVVLATHHFTQARKAVRCQRDAVGDRDEDLKRAMFVVGQSGRMALAYAGYQPFVEVIRLQYSQISSSAEHKGLAEHHGRGENLDSPFCESSPR
jgi:hypothetical protein